MRTTFVLAIAAVVSVAACSSETGVLVSTTTQEGFNAEIHSLRFYVGEDVVASNEQQGAYFADQDPLDDVDVKGMDLATKAYKLLIHPRNSSDVEARIAIGVFALDGEGEVVGFGYVPDPVGFVSGSITQWDVEIHGLDGPDFFRGPNNCFKWQMDDWEWMHIGRDSDADCDGVTVDEGDCNDLNPDQLPGKAERCHNGIDDDCNGFADSEDTVDYDSDGFTACPAEGPADCDDHNRNVNPEQDEVCNGVDDNCNGMCDESDVIDGETDKDGDHVTFCGSVLNDTGGRCTFYDPSQPDCDDDNDQRFPGNAEVPDGIDNNCSLVCDDDPSLDGDMDGYTEWGRLDVCSESDINADCATDNPYRYPGAQEFCDGVDSDCDGNEIKNSPCYRMVNTECREGTRPCDAGAVGGECLALRDTANPLPTELCDTYTDCVGAANDPYYCVVNQLGMAATVMESCVARSLPGAGCDGDKVTMMLPGDPVGPACSYQLVGPSIQQGYRLGIGSLGNVVSQDCQTSLAVQGQANAGEATIYILFDNGDGLQKVIQVNLTHRVVEECNGQSGLSCTAWPNVM